MTRRGVIRLRGELLILLTLTALLSACKPEIRIQPLSLALPAPVFRLAMDGYGRAHFVSARVVGEDGAVLWSIEAKVPGVLSGASELVYGAPPEGFHALAGPVPLDAGVRYRLILGGKGFGQIGFTPIGSTGP